MQRLLPYLLPLVAHAQVPLPFDLNKPVARHQLPPELMEISALTDVDARTVACVQDEAATLYLLDVNTGSITGRRTFGGPGDLEGLTRVGAEYYALRSDGLIYRMLLGPTAMTVLDSFTVRLPQNDLEGLGYDERHGLVLISPKGVEKGDPTTRDRRAIHGYDIATKRLLPEPVLSFTVTGIIAQAEAGGWKVPMRQTSKGRSIPALKLRFSSVAVDPISGHYYLLSAADRHLLVLDRGGKLVALCALDPDRFAKPEGITFMPDGAMIISNEGKAAAPDLVRYERRSTEP